MRGLGRGKQGHNDEDIRCKFYWGDRSGMDMRARCPICNPKQYKVKTFPKKIFGWKLTATKEIH